MATSTNSAQIVRIGSVESSTEEGQRYAIHRIMGAYYKRGDRDGKPTGIKWTCECAYHQKTGRLCKHLTNLWGDAQRVREGWMTRIRTTYKLTKAGKAFVVRSDGDEDA